MAPQTQPLAADALPPLRDWVGTAGFTGACAILAALIILLAALITARRADKRQQREMDQREQQHDDTRTSDQRTAAIDQCWQRLVWVITTADTEPAATDPATASMGLGPELAEELLKGIGRDATELGDETLQKAAAVYLNQLGLVLTQQTQRLTEVAAAARSLGDRTSGAHAATPAGTADPNTKPDTAPATGEGRRRR